MFERRLKISLGVLLGVMSILLLRAFHLQVVTRGQWVKAADDFKKKAIYVETTRGRILDNKGQELAVDEACMDACVDYRAITRDPVWINAIALKRAATVDGWAKGDTKQRKAILDDATAEVKRNIDDMFVLVAKETGRDPEQIEDTCHQIDLRVAMSRRFRQFTRFEKAEKDTSTAKGAVPWYRRWLGGGSGPEIDDFTQPEGEEVGVHPLVRGISTDAYLHLARALPQCPGLVLRPGTHRVYRYGKAACHLLGTVSTVQEEDMKGDAHLGDPLLSYHFNDTIGRGGLESLCEPSLRGKRGKSYKSAASEEDDVDSVPVPGMDVKTTIDIELQAKIQQMFAHMQVQSNLADDKTMIEVPMHGAAVVIDVKTSNVLALASYPDYDVNALQDNIEKFIEDGRGEKLLDAPLLNRATQSQLEPGSTIKPVVGLSAITQGLKVPDVGVMTIQTGIHCTGFLVLNGRKLPNGRCWTASKWYATLGEKAMEHRIPFESPHRGVYGNPDGYLCFADALERSCNVYFETVADAFDIDGLSYWYDRFGLGRETGVGISEACGFLPSEIKVQQKSVAWFSGIGQVGVRATPIQMANVAATIARDGIWMRPRLVDGSYALNPVKPRGGETIPDRVDLQLNKEALAAARDGMVRVVNSEAGTGKPAHMNNLLVAGKTGTAQAAEIRDPELDGDGHPDARCEGQDNHAPARSRLDRSRNQNAVVSRLGRGREKPEPLVVHRVCAGGSSAGRVCGDDSVRRQRRRIGGTDGDANSRGVHPAGLHQADERSTAGCGGELTAERM